MLPNATYHPSPLAHQFGSLDEQKEAATLGMWIFLVTEVLFFGGLFATYMVYRMWYPAAFTAASGDLVVWAGTTNTAVLITSSLTMALAGCVSINAPDKPIEINLNINVKQEVVYRLDNQAKTVIQSNPGIF